MWDQGGRGDGLRQAAWPTRSVCRLVAWMPSEAVAMRRAQATSRVCPGPASSLYGAGARSGETSRPRYVLQVGQTRCDCFGDPHCSHVDTRGAEMACCARRLSRRDLEVFRFGTAMSGRQCSGLALATPENGSENAPVAAARSARRGRALHAGALREATRIYSSAESPRNASSAAQRGSTAASACSCGSTLRSFPQTGQRPAQSGRQRI